MRRLLSIFFLFIYLGSFSEVGQLFKLPQLIEHFEEHRSQEPRLSMIAFLKMHYKGVFNVDDDYKEDQRLPFRNSVNLAYVFVVCEAPRQVSVPVPYSNLVSKTFFTNNDSANHLWGHIDIFQPPREDMS